MIAGEIVLAYPRTIKILKKGIRLWLGALSVSQKGAEQR